MARSRHFLFYKNMRDKIDINELLVLENELKLMKIISNAIVTNRISLEEHYNFIVRDVIFPQANADIMEWSDSSPIWKLARHIVKSKDIKMFISHITIMRGTGFSSKAIASKRFVQEIIKSFDLKENEETENCLNRIVELLEILIQQNRDIELHDMFAKGSKKDTVINNSNIISYESDIKTI